ncbi:transcriptional regulator, sarp family protein [Tritonibacter mobilis]|uniref:transcriptional regulator, sarp family protein n=2 Tax=Tritonibacter mobilis TaxID=379347 RepID=UPI00080696C8|nr:transcriptional regulator, sarp family protein [Tritonibacter mobilis]
MARFPILGFGDRVGMRADNVPEHITYHVNLFGPFEVTTSEGDVLHLPSKRGRALIAALATGRKRQRTRDWLQDLLWQGRGKAQASASLRQELRLLRKAFAQADVILSEHGTLTLNPDLVTTNAAEPLATTSGEFLEGLDLPAPFDGWLLEQRAALSAPCAPQDGAERTSPEPPTGEPIVYFNRTSPDQLDMQTANEVFQCQIEKGLADLAPLEFRYTSDDSVAADHTLVKTQILEAGRETLLRVVMPGHSNGQSNWTAHWRGMQQDLLLYDDDELLQLAYRAQEAAVDALSLSETRKNKISASLLGFRALRNIFSMDRPDLDQADSDLQAAYERVPKGIFLAWRAFIQANLIVESTDLDPGHQAHLSANLARRALQSEPENAALKAAASHVFLLTGQDPIAAGELARDATALNPSNPLAWASWANAEIAMGQLETAAGYSRKALQIGRFSRSRHWWEMQAGVSAALVGNYEAARVHSRMAHSLVPSFRPPLRYLAALEQQRGDGEAVDTLKDRMRDLEPGFDMSDLSEPEYPSGNLRRAGLA